MNGRFAVLSLNAFLQKDGFIFEFYTDSPCHLWLRHTPTEPVTHLEPVLRRGLQIHCNPRFCFVAYLGLEQHEEGDTLVHSFNFHPFPDYEMIWCYLYGTIGGVDSPSTSPIMHFPLDVKNAIERRHQRGWAESGQNVTYNKPKAVTLHITVGFFITGVRLYLRAPPEHRKIRLAIHPCDWINRPCGSAITFCELDHLPDKFKFPNKGHFFFPLPRCGLQHHTRYAICVWGDPDYPDDIAMWWSVFWPDPDNPGEESFYGEKVNNNWRWGKYNDRMAQYQLWDLTGYYQPAPFDSFWLPGQEPKYPLPESGKWYEEWGFTLNDNHIWNLYGLDGFPTYSLDSGILTLTNPGYQDCGIVSSPDAGQLPLQNESRHNLHALAYSPEATANSSSSQIVHELILRKNGSWFTLYLCIAHGPEHEDTSYGYVAGRPYGWITISTDPADIDLVAMFQRFSNLLGLDPNPDGWELNLVVFAMGTFSPSCTDYLKNDYIGFTYV